MRHLYTMVRWSKCLNYSQGKVEEAGELGLTVDRHPSCNSRETANESRSDERCNFLPPKGIWLGTAKK